METQYPKVDILSEGDSVYQHLNSKQLLYGYWNHIRNLLELNFNPNSTQQNWFVRWCLHPLYILSTHLISSCCGISNTPPHVVVYISRAWDLTLMSGLIAV